MFDVCSGFTGTQSQVSLHSVHVPRSSVNAERTSVNDDHKEAQKTWDQAEKALAKRVKAKKEESPQTSTSSTSRPPRQKKGAGLDDSDFEDFHYEWGKSDADDTRKPDKPRETLDEIRARTRMKAGDERARQQRMKAQDATLRNRDHAKRLLRVKICDVLREVKRRQGLHEQQVRGHTKREQVHARGLGIDPDFGEATRLSLGLPGLDKDGHLESRWAQGAASPRRTALLESLSLSELDLMRRDSGFYFRGPIISLLNPNKSNNAVPKEDEDEEDPEVGSLEILADFFCPMTADKGLEIKSWQQKLLARAAPDVSTDLAMSHTQDDTLRLKRSSEHRKELEFMPCLGRNPLVHGGDMASPTLAKVREVFNKREIADAQWVEEKRQTMVHRLAQNAFKAREQQREMHLQVFRAKELHKVRMLEAEERKAIFNAEQQEHKERMEVFKHQQVELANDRVDDMIEARRDRVTSRLEDWRDGVDRSQRVLQTNERARRRRGWEHDEDMRRKLEKVAEQKHNLTTTMAQRNQLLRSRITGALNSQLLDKEQQRCAELHETIEDRLDAAAGRRAQVQRGTYYNYCDKAFGARAYDYDAKDHQVSVDRRDPSWKRTQRQWEGLKGSYSEPSLPAISSPSREERELQRTIFGDGSRSDPVMHSTSYEEKRLTM